MTPSRRGADPDGRRSGTRRRGMKTADDAQAELPTPHPHDGRPSPRGRRIRAENGCLLGPALPTADLVHERLGKPTALAVFASDNFSSVAYATEEIRRSHVIAGAARLRSRSSCRSRSGSSQSRPSCSSRIARRSRRTRAPSALPSLRRTTSDCYRRRSRACRCLPTTCSRSRPPGRGRGCPHHAVRRAGSVPLPRRAVGVLHLVHAGGTSAGSASSRSDCSPSRRSGFIFTMFSDARDGTLSEFTGKAPTRSRSPYMSRLTGAAHFFS